MANIHPLLSYKFDPVALPDKEKEANEEMFDDMIAPDRPYLSLIFVWLNTIIAVSFRNGPNLKLKSKKSSSTYKRYKSERDAGSRGAEEESPTLRTGQNMLAALGRNHAKRNLNQIDLGRRLLKIPARISFIYWLVLCGQFFIVIRCIYTLAVLFFSSTELAMTCTKNLRTSLKPVEVFEIETTAGVGSRCDQAILELLATRYQGFMLWNETTGTIFSKTIERELLFESHPLVQMYHEENKMLVSLLLVFVLICGICSTVIGNIRPFDISVLVFMYDPEFKLYQFRRKLNSHMKTLRESYQNFCDKFMLRRLSRRLSGQQTDDFHGGLKLYASKLDSYKLQARSQSWRRLLLIMQPIFYLVMFLLVTSMLLFIYTRIILHNFEATDLNLELKQIYESGHLPEASPFDQLIEVCNDSTRLVGNRVLTNLIILVRDNFKSEYLQSLETNEDSFGQRLALLLRPHSKPNGLLWMLTMHGLLILTSLVTIFYIVYTLCLVDLCIWFVEIRAKLMVYKFILYHYMSCDPYVAQPMLIRKSAARSSESTLIVDTLPALKSVIGSEAEIISTIPLGDILAYNWLNMTEKSNFCKHYARKLVQLDLSSKPHEETRIATHKFMLTSYLDFRMFLDEIESTRMLMTSMISFAVFNAFNVVINCATLSDANIRVGLLVLALWILNVPILMASFFQSQCRQLHNPIQNILIASWAIQSDMNVQHLAFLWRELLSNLAASRTQLCFRIYSFSVTYATSLQVSLLN